MAQILLDGVRPKERTSASKALGLLFPEFEAAETYLFLWETVIEFLFGMIVG